MTNGIDSTVGDLENDCALSGQCNQLSPRSAPLAFGHKKLRANKRKPRVLRAVGDQTGGSRIAEGLMKIRSRRRWSYGQSNH